MTNHESTELTPVQRVSLYGIHPDTWEDAQSLGWKFVTNVGLGEYSYFTTMVDRGYEVRLGCPMGADGPIEQEVPDDPNAISFQPSGIYCRRPQIDLPTELPY